jgi:integrase
MKVAGVSAADVADLHQRISNRAPTQANRALAVLSKMFSLAVRWGWRADNPCRGIERNQEAKRQRFLTRAETTRLLSALNELGDQGAANAVWLLLLTGARRGELLAAKWCDIDLDERTWTKPGATTKQKTVHRVPLSETACRLLLAMRKQANDEAVWVFPDGRNGHRANLNTAWATLRKTAGIPDVRLHDLRHHFASMLASAGQSLPVIGALLGHSTPQTTQRYSHLFDDPLRAATEHAAAILSEVNSSGQGR